MIPDEALFECRTLLSELSIPADDLDDDVVEREAILREQVAWLTSCRMLPGSWEKRFVREVRTFPDLLTEKQEKAIMRLWKKYRGQLRARQSGSLEATGYFPATIDLRWPTWLPPVPPKR